MVLEPFVSINERRNQEAQSWREKQRHHVRTLIWVYVVLYIFEGSLRKWIVPSLSEVLLFAREPVLLAIYCVCWRARMFPMNWLTLTGVILSAFSFIVGTAVMRDPLVAFIGFRATFMHLPLAFIIGETFRPSDIRRLGLFFLYLAIPMAILMVIQYRQTPEHWLNAAAYEGAKQIDAGEGKVRPAGTFSFINGPITFYAMVCCFSIVGFFGEFRLPKWLAVLALAATIIAGGVSASRGFLLTVAVSVSFPILIALVVRPQLLSKAVVAIMLAAAILVAAISTSEFQEGWKATGGRVNNTEVSSEADDRILKDITLPFEQAFKAPLFGYGYGSITNVGNRLLQGNAPNLGRDNEREWSRHLYESGTILGGGFIIWRICFLGTLFGMAIRSLRRGSLLSMSLVCCAGPTILTGNFGQPSMVALAVIGAGMALAAQRMQPGSAVAAREASG